ncbi:MAG: NTP transferase domain-containing protein [Desulfarculus sp.]|nr:NTP transferase domain-containing protein [Desulfarculus sp.]
MTASDSKKLAASCLILAGGKGTRLSPDKPLLEINGQAIIARTAEVAVSLFAEVLVVTNTPQKYGFLGLPLVADQRQGRGPLMGIYSGLLAARHETAFVCAADMPFLNPGLIRAQYEELDGHDIVVPCPWGRPEFLHAFYRKGCLPAMGQALEAGILKIESLAGRCHTLRLDQDWFARRGLTLGLDLAFVNINTMEEYCRWQGQGHQAPSPPSWEGDGGPDALGIIAPEVLRRISQTLIEQETAYQRQMAQEELSSLWAHSSRVGRIAHRIARAEGWEPGQALLAGLLHDTGKFAQGRYHADDTPEEEHAVEFARSILAGSVHQAWLPEVSQAILSMYQAGQDGGDLGRALYDADSLDKLGCMGVAQFFAKNALRRRFLDDDLLARASIELTYAHHAPGTLKTAFGRALARQRGSRTRRFYEELLEEWRQLGLGVLDILEEDIGGITCLLVVPRACSCGGRLEPVSDIRDALKCRSVIVKYSCGQCGGASQYSFCLPNVRGLPPRG